MTHYDTLQIPSTATPEQIKKQFRKLSLEYHPDRPNGNASLFQQINEAYEVLSDPVKRSAYDTPAPKEINNIYPPSCSNPFPLHLLIPSIELKLTITLEQAYTGGSHPIQVNRMYQGKHETETCYITIPPGTDEEIMTIKGKGHYDMGYYGDVRVRIYISPHTLERNGLDLIYTHSLSLKDALCGCSFDIPYLSGKKIKINPGEMIIHPQYKKVIPNMGMKRNATCGNLILQFNIQFPVSLAETQKQWIRDNL